MKYEWDDEPDQKDWTSERHRLPCAIRRTPSMGTLCGYVGIPSGHPLFAKDYEDADVDVHGGLTYGADHVAKGPSDGMWWFGFDCAHGGDAMPGLGLDGRAILFSGDVYRNMAYVEAECEKLAGQLVALGVTT